MELPVAVSLENPVGVTACGDDAVFVGSRRWRGDDAFVAPGSYHIEALGCRHLLDVYAPPDRLIVSPAAAWPTAYCTV
jgi:hypothetical protein